MIYPNTEITPDSACRNREMKSLYERYKGSKEGVPILVRKYMIDGIEQKGKVNNKLSNDFFSEIIDMKVGFFCGIPISYTIDKNNYNETEYDKIIESIKNFNKINSIAECDLETSKRVTICGLSGRLYYYDEDSNIRIKQINPWELIFLGETIDDPVQTIRLYSTTGSDGKEIKHADVYNNTEIKMYEYKVYNGLSSYILEDKWELVLTVPHLMPFNPLIGFANNDEYLGDAEKVLSLIDAYDKALSDINSEIEQFRLAYLAAYGFEISEETVQMAIKTGAFSITDPQCKLEFLTKHLDDTILEHHLDRLERNIYRFSRTPNMNDQSFAGQITGVALKYKFRSFEDKCTTSELKYKKSLRQQSKILSAIWENADSIISNYLDYEFVFTRKYPQNLIEEIDFLVKAKGIIPDSLAFSLVSFIEDPEKIKEELEEQQQLKLDDFLSKTQPVDSSAPVSKPVPAQMKGKSESTKE